MSGKRNISYVKPQDPSFLAKLKSQIGYKEGPTIEAKRQRVDFEDNSSDSEGRPDREEEKPQIVVLQKGDLNAEEVGLEEARIAKEAAEARADLSKPIVFHKRKEKCRNTETLANTSSSKSNSNGTNTSQPNKTNKEDLKSIKKKREKQANKLSFNLEEEDDE
ncbi:uncharacterized protein KIAA1143 homolog [Ceratitis capitata]|uniref:Uncharacterized protein KIAA1143 n=2 Tax=Ceratitis capitata TaxID=7213 RepID=W8BNU2_CERCA|nr:uncharacterized protein KIAA1143 homolog [Ceratitis capitata]